MSGREHARHHHPKTIVLTGAREIESEDELIVVSDNWAVGATVILPKCPEDLEVHRFSDAFSKITSAAPLTIDGHGRLIAQTDTGAPPAGQFLWDGGDAIGGGITTFLRYFEVRYAKPAGIWILTANQITFTVAT